MTGSNLPVVGLVQIGNTEVQVLTSDSTTITFSSPKMAPGLYKIVIPIGNGAGNVRYGSAKKQKKI